TGTTVGLQRGGDRVAATLAEAQVVFAAAAFVGVAFQRHAGGRTITEVLGVARHRGLEFRTQRILVEIEVDDALAQAGIRVQVVRTVRTRGGGRLGHRRRGARLRRGQ